MRTPIPDDVSAEVLYAHERIFCNQTHQFELTRKDDKAIQLDWQGKWPNLIGGEKADSGRTQAALPVTPARVSQRFRGKKAHYHFEIDACEIGDQVEFTSRARPSCQNE